MKRASTQVMTGDAYLIIVASPTAIDVTTTEKMPKFKLPATHRTMIQNLLLLPMLQMSFAGLKTLPKLQLETTVWIVNRTVAVTKAWQPARPAIFTATDWLELDRDEMIKAKTPIKKRALPLSMRLTAPFSS
mmetsp:Transcript_91282/g.254968  ORF Transcript_91282/g.254968 Transcript_91282/m.254968 type:complete len:132 (-) Transcript_91282:175-570(-)